MPNTEISKGRHRGCSNAVALLKMLQVLNMNALCQAEIREQVGISAYTCVKWLRIAKRMHLVYVAKWKRPLNTGGQPTPYYAAGFKHPDEPRPKPLSVAEYSRNYRIRKAMREKPSVYDKITAEERS